MADQENLPVARPGEVKERLTEIKREMNDRFLEMGQLLLEAVRNNYHRSLGYSTFDLFVQETLDIGYRTAKYLMDVYDTFVDQIDAPREVLSEVGWSKAKELLGVVNKDNAAQWLDYAKNHKATEINKAVRQAQAESGVEVEEYANLTVGVFDNEREIILEAIELASRETGNTRQGFRRRRVTGPTRADIQREWLRTHVMPEYKPIIIEPIPRRHHDDDDLDAFRGLVCGAIISVVLWAVIGWCVWGFAGADRLVDAVYQIEGE